MKKSRILAVEKIPIDVPDSNSLRFECAICGRTIRKGYEKEIHVLFSDKEMEKEGVRDRLDQIFWVHKTCLRKAFAYAYWANRVYEKGMKDVKEGKVVPMEEVMKELWDNPEDEAWEVIK